MPGARLARRPRDPGAPLRIVIAAASTGGVGDVAAATTRRLRRRGHSVSRIDIPIRERSAWHALRAAWRGRGQLRAADAVHLEFGCTDMEVAWFAVLAVAVRRDCVYVVHDHPRSLDQPGSWLIPTRRRRLRAVAHRILAPVVDPLVERWLTARAGAVVVFGDEARAAWRHRGVRRVFVTTHGGRAPREAPPRPSTAKSVVFAGVLAPSKGLQTLLEAWRRIGDEVDLPLTIVGDAPIAHAEWLAALRREASGMANAPRFVGSPVSEAEFEQAIARAAIVVMPYRFSNPASGILVRSLWAGRPVIATPVPAVAPVIVDRVNGRLVPIDDAASLADAISELASSPGERDRLGDAARATAEERFSWTGHIDGLERAYRSGRSPCASR